MKTVFTLIENLKEYQQQSVVDILATVQEEKRILQKQTGLIGCSIELFPIEEVKRLFCNKPDLKRTANRTLAEYGCSDHGFINLKNIISVIIETEVERRITEHNQKNLFDLAEEIEEKEE